jgi:hypothetical protein
MIASTVSETMAAKGREPELPNPLGEVFLEIENQVVALHAEWGIYAQLFEKDEDWNLLVQTSRFAWPVLHDALIERCILRITRLTDPAKSGKDKLNLSFAYLIHILKSESHDRLCGQLDTTLGDLKQQLKPLVDLRHKVLAHSDLSVSLKKGEYPLVSINMINELLLRIRDFCQKVRDHFALGNYDYDWCVDAWARGIVEHLQTLQRFETLRDRVHDGEPLDVYELRRAIMAAGRETE